MRSKCAIIVELDMDTLLIRGNSYKNEGKTYNFSIKSEM